MSAKLPRYPTVHLSVPEDEAEIAGSFLFDAGATGLETRDETTIERPEGGEVTLVAHFDEEVDAERAARDLSERWPAKVVYIVGDEWRDSWKRFFKPTRVGEHLVVRPSWEPFEPRAGDLMIVIDPDQAFGTGTHETTQLVMQELETRVKADDRVLDVGCGSGILSIAALKLGAKSAVGVDIDPIAARIANENAALNDVDLVASDGEVHEVEGTFDLVLANIRGPILIPIAGAVAEHVAEEGHLILSGLLIEEEADVRAAYDPELTYVDRRVAGEWLALTYRR